MHSLDFSKEALEIKDALEKQGHEVSLCYSVQRVKDGNFSVGEIVDLKEKGTFSDYTISKDLIRWNWERLQKDDAILVINLTKRGITNYIGGNTLIEMGFAHVLRKKIFLWNGIPDMPYTDELKAMQPLVINHDIGAIK